MIRKLLWLPLLAGHVAMVWYGATGETGPMLAPSAALNPESPGAAPHFLATA